MGRVKNEPHAAPVPVHASWSTELASQLHTKIRDYLGCQQQTIFESYTTCMHTHLQTSESIKYYKIVTRKQGMKKSRLKHYYACDSPQYICTNVCVYDDKDEFFSHIHTQHKPHITCSICSSTITPSQYKTHYDSCSRITDASRRQARKQQVEDMEQENLTLMEELNDTNQQTDVIEKESELVKHEEDIHQYMPRSKQTGEHTTDTSLLRIESLVYYDLASPVKDEITGKTNHKQWSPQRCEKNDKCNVVQHGTFIRFCYDAVEPFLLEIKRYKCTTHFIVTKKKKSNVTFSMISECVDKEMIEKQTVRKSIAVTVFDSVLITTNMWLQIANMSLVTLNDSQVNTIIKHTYKRRWAQKHGEHMDHERACEPSHQCTPSQCYGLTMQKAEEWVKLYETIHHRALDIATTRAIYQRHVFPTAVLAKHSQLQHTITTEHCTNAISFDDTFRMAKFGIYNEILDDSKTVATTINAPPANAVMQTNDAPASTALDNAYDPAVKADSKPVKRKRKYNQSVTFTKLNAQLMTVMDSNGFALCSYVVPSGKSVHQLRCLQQLLTMQHTDGKPVRIDTVSIDNASQFGPGLKAHYRMLTGKELTVLQDLYHARERVEREFVFGHPLIGNARSEWRQLIGDVVQARCTLEDWRQRMIAYRDKYSEPVKYSAVGLMDTVSRIGKSLLVNDVRLKQVLSGEELAEMYSRHHPNDIDDSNDIAQAVLRKPGVTALNNLISDANIAYVFDRTQAHCVNTKGTTPNEALHRIFNGRLSRFGGIRTFASAQQSIIVVQYQYNSHKLYDTGQYWCDISYLPIHSIRQSYRDPLGEPDIDLLSRFEIEWSKITKWLPSHTVKLREYIIALSTGQLYCHTKSLCQWLSQQEGMEGTKSSEIGKHLREMQEELLTTPPTPPVATVGNDTSQSTSLAKYRNTEQ